MRAVVLSSLGLLMLCGCAKQVNERPVGASIRLKTPLGLPPLPVPDENPLTAEAVALGRKLYFDKRLSSDGTVSCASCHDPAKGFADARKVSEGVGKQTGTRNAPTVLNAAYGSLQFWDGRAGSLEHQAAGPIANPVEMNLPHEECVQRLQAISEYAGAFAAAYGEGPITIGKVQGAIAAFERTLLSGNSPFDRYFYGGDKAALSPAAIRGMALFLDRDKGNCAACHQVGQTSALFTDGQFHNLGAGLSPEGELTDLGRFSETKREADRGAFKTPTLRNVALTAPYMHDGSLKSLRQVVDFYAGGGSSNPHLDALIQPLALTGLERADLVAFLEALTGDLPPVE